MKVAGLNLGLTREDRIRRRSENASQNLCIGDAPYVRIRTSRNLLTVVHAITICVRKPGIGVVPLHLVERRDPVAIGIGFQIILGTQLVIPKGRHLRREVRPHDGSVAEQVRGKRLAVPGCALQIIRNDDIPLLRHTRPNGYGCISIPLEKRILPGHGNVAEFVRRHADNALVDRFGQLVPVRLRNDAKRPPERIDPHVLEIQDAIGTDKRIAAVKKRLSVIDRPALLPFFDFHTLAIA